MFVTKSRAWRGKGAVFAASVVAVALAGGPTASAGNFENDAGKASLWELGSPLVVSSEPLETSSREGGAGDLQLAAAERFLEGMVFLAAAVKPEMSPEAKPTEFDRGVFKSDPTYEDKPYDAEGQIEIYGGKYDIDEPRPVIEIGRPLYREGPFREGTNIAGEKNLFFEHLQVYGDWRTAVAYNDNGATEAGLVATRLNLDVDLKLTATERLHAFFRPIDDDGDFTRYEFFGDNSGDLDVQFDPIPETYFFEGDLGAIWQGITGEYNTLDLPITGGKIPMIFQNGVWVEDAFLGGAMAFPAMNSKALDISNFDVTIFAGFDNVTTRAITDNDGDIAESDVNVYGIATFAEALEGYIEAGYGFVHGRAGHHDKSYHSITGAFTRRYGGWLSNSVRAIGTFGQDPEGGVDETAEGFILLVENSLITHKPLTLVPYLNAWVGYDRPVPLAREDGVLKNTGINFETDGLTGFPKLDDSGQDTFGAALGIEYLFDLDQQIVVEAAGLKVIGGPNEAGRPAVDDQFAIGARYQLPLSNAWILRADAMYGWLKNAPDIGGARVELRVKF